MRSIWNMLLRGFATILPVGLTVYLIYWLAVTVESASKTVLVHFIPSQYYFPGLGFLIGIVILFLTGLVVNAWIVRALLGLWEDLIERIPLIKSVYSGLKDFMGFFSKGKAERDIQRVVLLTLGEAKLVGFLTADTPDFVQAESDEHEYVSVYLPMSYQVGGYTVYVPRASTKALDISVEDAMRMVLTSGVSKSKARS